MQLRDAVDLREKASFPPAKSHLGGSVGRRLLSGQWGRLLLCPGGEGQAEMSKGVLERGRLWTPSQGRASVSEAPAPEGVA